MPEVFSPQQYAAPDVDLPQVRYRPAVMDVKTMPPATGAGPATGLILPIPSSPALLSPQQYAAPAVVRPQLCPYPATTEPNDRPPETATSDPLGAVGPPSSPALFTPQQYPVEGVD